MAPFARRNSERNRNKFCELLLGISDSVSDAPFVNRNPSEHERATLLRVSTDCTLHFDRLHSAHQIIRTRWLAAHE